MNPQETFIDEAILLAFAGDGGDGFTGFRREKFIPRGGPDGGDGGRGGDVVLVADRNLATLLDQRMRRENRAESGRPGEGNNRTGRNGQTLEVRVPVGTIVRDLDAGEDGPVLTDLASDGDRYLAARGGRGGRGNARFATATRQTPDHSERGRAGGISRLRLSLKLLADVGLIGFPNAGKSTLLGAISAARPRVAAYPFTTLVPSLGVAEVGERRFVVADVPGLIKGASEGLGLGDRFLRHVERTRVLVHLIDVGTALLEARDPLPLYDAIRDELAAYQPALMERRELVVLNKIDLVADRGELDAIEAAFRARGCEVHRLSAATREGADTLTRAMRNALEEEEKAAIANPRQAHG